MTMTKSSASPSNHHNFGSNRSSILAHGTKVVVSITRHVPEHVSRKTGKVKPAENRSSILDGIVMVDEGHCLVVKVIYPSKYSRRVTVLPHQVSLESNWNKGNPLLGV